MAKGKLRIMAIGAHPDDCDIKVGGIALEYVKRGHAVKFVSATNGNAGHQSMGGGPLAQRRLKETQAVARVSGVEYEVLDNPDAGLEPTLENRRKIIRIIREFAPDLVITHRPNDYHPDHRYTSQLVQDAAYTVTVPNAVPLTPHLMANPSMAYMSDDFQKPYPFTPDIAVAIDDVAETKLRMLMCHESQFFEWLPYNAGVKRVPKGRRERLEFLRKWRHFHLLQPAERFREALVRLYGPERGAKARYAEALEICEYGAPITARNLHRLFPFYK